MQGKRWKAALLVTPLLVGTMGLMVSAKEVLNVGIAEWYETASEKYWTTTIIPAFEKLHPDYTVNVYKITWGADDMETKYLGGSAPDVIQFGGDKFGSFLPMLEPLNTYMKANPLDDPSDIAPGAMANVAKQGVQYGIPYNLDTRTLVYRKSLFENAGLDPNTGPDTWQDVANDAQKLVRKDSSGKITTEGMHAESSWFTFASEMFPFGGRYVTNDLQHSAFDSKETQAAVKFAQDLNTVYGVTLEKGYDWSTGQVAMEIGDNDTVDDPKIAADTGVPLPPSDGVHPRTTMASADSWGVINTSKHKQAAWDWIRLCMQAQNEAGIARTAGIIPTRISLSKEAPWNTPGMHGFFVAASMSHGFNGGAPDFENIVHNIISPALDGIIYGGKPLTYLATASQQVEADLKAHEKS